MFIFFYIFFIQGMYVVCIRVLCCSMEWHVHYDGKYLAPGLKTSVLVRREKKKGRGMFIIISWAAKNSIKLFSLSASKLSPGIMIYGFSFSFSKDHPSIPLSLLTDHPSRNGGHTVCTADTVLRHGGWCINITTILSRI